MPQTPSDETLLEWSWKWLGWVERYGALYDPERKGAKGEPGKFLMGRPMWCPLRDHHQAAMMRAEAARPPHNLHWYLFGPMPGTEAPYFRFAWTLPQSWCSACSREKERNGQVDEKDERRATVLGLYRAFAEEGDE